MDTRQAARSFHIRQSAHAQQDIQGIHSVVVIQFRRHQQKELQRGQEIHVYQVLVVQMRTAVSLETDVNALADLAMLEAHRTVNRSVSSIRIVRNNWLAYGISAVILANRHRVVLELNVMSSTIHLSVLAHLAMLEMPSRTVHYSNRVRYFVGYKTPVLVGLNMVALMALSFPF